MRSEAYGWQCGHSHWYSWSCAIYCSWGAIRAHHCWVSRKYWSHLELILKSIKCKWNGVARVPKIYYTAGCKSRWQAQQTGLLCSSFAVLPFSPASSQKPTLGFNKWIWAVIKISDPIGSWIYYLPRIGSVMWWLTSFCLLNVEVVGIWCSC